MLLLTSKQEPQVVCYLKNSIEKFVIVYGLFLYNDMLSRYTVSFYGFFHLT